MPTGRDKRTYLPINKAPCPRRLESNTAVITYKLIDNHAFRFLYGTPNFSVYTSTYTQTHT